MVWLALVSQIHSANLARSFWMIFFSLQLARFDHMDNCHLPGLHFSLRRTASVIQNGSLSKGVSDGSFRLALNSQKIKFKWYGSFDHIVSIRHDKFAPLLLFLPTSLARFLVLFSILIDLARSPSMFHTGAKARSICMVLFVWPGSLRGYGSIRQLWLALVVCFRPRL